MMEAVGSAVFCGRKLSEAKTPVFGGSTAEGGGSTSEAVGSTKYIPPQTPRRATRPCSGRSRVARPVPIFDDQRAKRKIEMTDLTKMLLPTDGTPEAQADHGMKATAPVEVIFRNHRERLIEEIGRYPVVVGCVAWLTDYAVLKAMTACRQVSVVVQKEDFLKPDTRSSNRRLELLYAALPKGDRYELPHLGGYSYCSDSTCDPVRCVGNHNSEKKPAWPRMHNKFLVFCDLVEPDPQPDGGWASATVTPRKVWTGSYNISDNASRSWENAVIIDDAAIADAYAKEFAQIFGFSEPLNWQSNWTAPTYRIGS